MANKRQGNNKPGNKQLVRRIQGAMAEQELSAYALAIRAGVGHATLSRVLAGEGDPSWQTVQRLALALGLRTDDLRDPELTLPEVGEPRKPGRPRKEVE
jgi:transcriptional regulator with XRE-family HTH domain